MQITITVRNAELVRRGLENLRREIPRISRERIYKAEQAVVNRMKRYPSRPRSNYVRTYRFGRAWRIAATMTGYTVSNRTPYGVYVVGDAFGNGQAWMHVPYWQKFRDVTEAEIEKLPKTVAQEIGLAVRRQGLAA